MNELTPSVKTTKELMLTWWTVHRHNGIILTVVIDISVFLLFLEEIHWISVVPDEYLYWSSSFSLSLL
jgi:hypothetical protein